MFTNILTNRLLLLLLFSILILAASVRFYKYNQVPPSLNWDEVAVGYNAWSITSYGKDEWGNFLPLTFKSFEDVKKPVNVYITAISVLIFGLSDFAVRLPAVLFGLFNTILVFFLARKIFKNESIGLISSFFFAISPYNIHFSRFNHEANIVLFLFMAGVLLFIKGIEEKKYLFLLLSEILFLFSLLTYNAALIIVPLLFIALVLLNLKKLLNTKAIITFLLPLLVYIFIVFMQPTLLGSSRADQVIFSDGEIKKSIFFQNTHNLFISRGLITLNQYFYYFSPNYLFIKGDKNPRLSLQEVGEFYFLDAPLLLVGLIGLLKKNKWLIFLALWGLIAPLPGSLVKEAPHAGRGIFMMGSWQIISAFGFYVLLSWIKSRKIKVYFIGVFLIIYLGNSFLYLNNYFTNYSQNYPHDWQYGMKQAAEYIKEHPEYNEVYITNVRAQPYIFFLYYLKIPLPEYLNSVEYNYSETRSHNLVNRFSKYFFDWEVIESSPDPGKMYIVSTSEYDGLRYKLKFKIKRIIYYPNRSEAFYIVSVS